MTKDVLLISFSAFFADLGYQAIQAIFPIYLVITLASTPLTFGIATAIAFGGGALFAYAGGVLSDRYSRKWIAVMGSMLILLMSAVGLTISPVLAIALFAGGWWGRNFRSPPRRAMLADASKKKDLGRVFGFLHLLDIGGGILSVIILILLLASEVSQKDIFLITAIPLSVSVFLLLITRDIRESKYKSKEQDKSSMTSRINRKTFNGVIFATALYGFSYYSLGFPILTIAKVASSNLLGIGSYGIYLGVSAITGYYIGSRKKLNKITALGYLGYMLSGVGTAVLALAYGLNYGIAALYLGVAIMGFGFGVVETMEPTIISLVRKEVKIGKGMGSLQGSRSLGIFFGNLIMGILYISNPSYSYTYAAVVSIVAGILIIYYGIGFER